MKLPSRLKSAIWFAQRPSLYSHALGIAYDRFFLGPEPDTSAAAVAWCGERAIDAPTAILQLTGEPAGPAVSHLFPEVFARATEIEKSCPVWMGGPGDLDLLYYLVLRSKASRVIETGVAYGWSSLAILLALKDRQDARLISSDLPYVQGQNAPYVGCVVNPDELRVNWQLERKPDRQVLPRAIAQLGTLDICHYDSDKSYRGRRWAYELLWRALRPGGFLISDDIGDDTGFRDFVNTIPVEPVVVLTSTERHSKYVGVLKKS